MRCRAKSLDWKRRVTQIQWQETLRLQKLVEKWSIRVRCATVPIGTSETELLKFHRVL
ncbi:hypothetical protein HOLleu_07073 [Holothuria leucospilota]|uniref:Uncharacterized protein n=1 Tax=Holothuria leucospilota TaxID=206669 RepID=A0A9Q1CGN1_HOLLE|nr:hypothetical protein HOLleu_07073 [Holothuria leucospilota]